MVSTDLRDPQAELFTSLQRLMFLRVLFVSFLLGASIFVQIKETKTYFGDIQSTHYVLIALIYFLSFIYAILIKHTKNLLRLAYFQLSVDTLLVTAIIYATGGIESIFSFLYILVIIGGSIILYRRGGMIIASASSILYGILLDLHYYGVIHPLGSRQDYPGEYQSSYILYMIIVNIAAFYLVAFLSSYASEKARRSGVELKAKQEDLSKLEALNEWIIKSIASALITVDERNRIILFNPAAEAIFGVEARDTIGRNLDDVLPFLKEHLQIQGTERRNKEQSVPVPLFDFDYLRPDGEKMFLRGSVSPLTLPEGDQKGEILFFQDMTKMKQIEEEMKKVESLALVGELAAGIAHEIRNPMASISGSIQILKEDLGKDEVRGRLMDIVLREVGRLNHLVSDFLLFARPKAHEIHEFDLNDLITDSLELFKHHRGGKENLRVKKEFHTPLVIRSDPEQIKQVLWNLFLNATEAMGNGGFLFIRTDLVHSDGSQGRKETLAQVSIRDTGQGFSNKALQHLFTPFFTTKEGGSGLGLAIVKRIVEGLGGEVCGTNHPEGGAEVTIKLPCRSN